MDGFRACNPLVPRVGAPVIGGEAIRAFSVVMICGIIVGTWSSIFIASPILLFLGQKLLRPELAAAAARAAVAQAT